MSVMLDFAGFDIRIFIIEPICFETAPQGSELFDRRKAMQPKIQSHRAFSLFLLLVIVLGLAQPGAAAARVQPSLLGTGQISGQVTDANSLAPLAGAQVAAQGLQNFAGLTDAAGYYTLTVAVDTYTVTASAFGYTPASVSGLQVLTDTLIVQDFALAPTASASVEGFITDVNTGWGLYASIVLTDVPGGPFWSDPVTGYYSITLPEGGSYEFSVAPWAPGYLDQTRLVGPLSGSQVEDFALDVDVQACTAPGYTVPSPGQCVPSSGRLLVGNVYDANTWEGLDGAMIANDGLYTATSQLTPDDPNLPDGFYTIFAPAPGGLFTITRSGGYAPGFETVMSAPVGAISDTLRQDFYLQAGQLGVVPPGLDVTLDYGQVQTYSLGLEDLGRRPLAFTTSEQDGGFLPVAPGDSPLADVPWLSSSPLTGSLPLPSPITPTVLWDQPLSTISLAPFPNQEYEPQDEIYNSVVADDFTSTQTWLIDSIYVPGRLFNGGTSLYNARTLNWAIYANQSGRPDGHPFGQGVPLWATARYPDDPQVTITTNAQGQPANTQLFLDEPLVLPPGAYWLVFYPSMPLAGGGQFGAQQADTLSGASAQWINPGNGYGLGTGWQAWAVLGATRRDRAFRLEGRTADAPRPIDVTFDASVPQVDQPGIYTAFLDFAADTPYGVTQAPLTMTVLAPLTWGKLNGTLTGLGYCEQNPLPLVGAQVIIESSGGMSWTLQTDAGGYYQRWLDQAGSPFTLTVSYPGYAAAAASGVIVSGQGITTQDFDLRWLQPCVSVLPAGLKAVVTQGFSTVLPLTLNNTGALSTTFNLLELPGPSLPPADVSWLSVAPASGVLAADGSQAVQVSFVSTPTMPLGVYTATLALESSDPFAPWLEVPVEMNVIPVVYDLALDGDQAQSGAPGSTLIYMVGITNLSNGPADTFDVSLGAHTWVSVLDANQVGPLAPGETGWALVNVTIPGLVTADDFDELTLTARSQGDPQQSAQVTLSSSVEPAFGLSLAPSSASQGGYPGDALMYALTVTNQANVLDTFDIAASGAGWFVQAPAVVGPLAPGESAAVDVLVQIPPDAAGGEQHQSQVLVTSHSAPAYSAASLLNTSVLRQVWADLALSMQAPASARVGEIITYTFSISNTGPDATLGVVLSNTLPAGMTFVSASAGCSQASGLVTCSLGMLASGSSLTVVIRAQAAGQGAQTDVAAVSSAANDPDPSNNSVSAQTLVTPAEPHLYLPFLHR